MVSTTFLSLIATLLLTKETIAFVSPSLVARRLNTPLFSASMAPDEAEGKALAKQFQRLEQDDLWLEQLNTPQIQEVRSEMVAKYIACGKPSDVAEQEVDAFLRDRERAQPFVEMRQYAKHKFDDMGLEIVVQTAVICLFCLFATIGLQYHSAYMVSHVWSSWQVTPKIPFSHVPCFQSFLLSTGSLPTWWWSYPILVEYGG